MLLFKNITLLHFSVLKSEKLDSDVAENTGLFQDFICMICF